MKTSDGKFSLTLKKLWATDTKPCPVWLPGRGGRKRGVWLWASYRLLPVVCKVPWMAEGRKYCKQGSLGIYSPQWPWSSSRFDTFDLSVICSAWPTLQPAKEDFYPRSLWLNLYVTLEIRQTDFFFISILHAESWEALCQSQRQSHMNAAGYLWLKVGSCIWGLRFPSFKLLIYIWCHINSNKE